MCRWIVLEIVTDVVVPLYDIPCLRALSRGADPGGAGGAAAPPILILVVQTYHFAPPIIPVHK